MTVELGYVFCWAIASPGFVIGASKRSELAPRAVLDGVLGLLQGVTIQNCLCVGDSMAKKHLIGHTCFLGCPWWVWVEGFFIPRWPHRSRKVLPSTNPRNLYERPESDTSWWCSATKRPPLTVKSFLFSHWWIRITAAEKVSQIIENDTVYTRYNDKNPLCNV